MKIQVFAFFCCVVLQKSHGATIPETQQSTINETSSDTQANNNTVQFASTIITKPETIIDSFSTQAIDFRISPESTTSIIKDGAQTSSNVQKLNVLTNTEVRADSDAKENVETTTARLFVSKLNVQTSTLAVISLDVPSMEQSLNSAGDSQLNPSVTPKMDTAVSTETISSTDVAHSTSTTTGKPEILIDSLSTQSVDFRLSAESTTAAIKDDTQTTNNVLQLNLTSNNAVGTDSNIKENVETTTELFVSSINEETANVTFKPLVLDLVPSIQFSSNSDGNSQLDSSITPKIDIAVSPEIISNTNVVDSTYTTTAKPEIVIDSFSTPSVEFKISPESTTSIATGNDIDLTRNVVNLDEDVKTLKLAQRDHEVDAMTVINVLTQKTHEQRLEIARQYKNTYNTDLLKDLKECKTTGWFKEVIIALLTPRVEYYTDELFEILYADDVNEDAVLEILSTLSNDEIKQMRELYLKTYEVTLESHIQYDFKGYFEELLLSLVKADRDESQIVVKTLAAADAKKLFEAGEMKWGTDESIFIEILTKHNLKQLKQIFDEYEVLTGHNIEQAIEREFSSSIRRGLLTIVKVVRSTPSFFAERLYANIKGSGANNKHLIRIITTRSDIDLKFIKIYYMANYGTSLQEAIIGNTSGDYKDALLGLVGGN